ncbi:MAG: hypothetical protein LBR25_00860 [Erysipelotrichaceae bacterium]|jgi:hypothetical protein|nr:hypothetical protein [Erysipelotrichaceae bacterium]
MASTSTNKRITLKGTSSAKGTYRYTCIYCGQDSGEREYTITKTVSQEVNANAGLDSIKIQTKLSLEAKSQLDKALKTYGSQTQTQLLKSLRPYISVKCPHCKKHQFWDADLRTLTKTRVITGFLVGIVPCVLLIIAKFSGGKFDPILPWLLGVAGWFVLCFGIGWLLQNSFKSKYEEANNIRVKATSINYPVFTVPEPDPITNLTDVVKKIL